jgi:hypothetical protein
MNRFRIAASVAVAATAVLGVSAAGTAHAATGPAIAHKYVETCRPEPTGSVDRGKSHIEPSWLSLSCDSDYTYLTGLRWSSWGVSQARATGAEAFDTCVPSCLAGKFVTYPVKVVLSGSMAVPGHPGELGYSTLTETFIRAVPEDLPKTIVWKLPLPA